ncbi:MAG: hypothetical protein EOM31_06255 [Bacteroidia bacterium]|nr:hypothetical protein [Bacteroidia bacterium]
MSDEPKQGVEWHEFGKIGTSRRQLMPMKKRCQQAQGYQSDKVDTAQKGMPMVSQEGKSCWL